MTTPDDVDRLVSDWLQDGAFEASEGPIQAAVAHALSHPRRRDPFAFLRKDAMNASRSILGLPPALAAAVGLVVVALAVVAGGSFLRTTTPIAPTPLPSESAAAIASTTPTAASSPTAAPSPTAATSSEPFLRQTQAGTAIPDSMLGTWYDASTPAFEWFVRAGDPYCIQVVATSQDCMAWQLGDGGTTYGGILSIIDGKLRVSYVNGSGCNGTYTLYAVTVTATKLDLIDSGGTCGSGDYHFSRVGSNSIPTAPATLNP